MSRAPLRVAVLGAGTVGLEVVRAFATIPDRLAAPDGRRLTLAGVAVRDLDRARARGVPADLLTDAPADLIALKAVDVIVETMGGDEPARTLVAAALGAGKPVVTANKHVVAHHGPELEAIARRSDVALRFEAAVAGGTPLLGPLAEGLAANEVRLVRGIVNGTTNHILTGMASGGRAYADVLAEAQAAGYAEADPSGDVEGDDAVNKVVILARLAFGRWLAPSSIERRPPTTAGSGQPGISGVTGDDLRGAAAVGLTIKLIARSERLDDGAISASVLPTALPSDSPLARTNGVQNRVEIEASPVGRVGFSGPGAGGAATSSAILADLLALARGAGSTWAALPPADGGSLPAAATDDDEPARRFFASALPDQLVRDQAEIATARSGGFVTAPRSLSALRSDLAAAGVSATLYPVDD